MIRPNILLANPRGFCAGVDRAIHIVKQALAYYGAPIYVRHELVHNRHVVAQFQKHGVVFVEEIDSIPLKSTVIFSAHGISPEVRAQAVARELRIFDATCPLVSKVHMEIAKCSRLGQECILIGHKDHPEVLGSLAYYTNLQGGIYLIENVSMIKQLKVKQPDTLHYVTQTTLSVDETSAIIKSLKRAFPNITGPKKDDICYATQNRQEAVKALANQSDLVLIVGSQNSSNANRLKEVAIQQGKIAYLIDSEEDIMTEWLTQNVTCIGVSAGASAPESLVQAVIKYLQKIGAGSVSELAGPTETIHFALPKALQSRNL